MENVILSITNFFNLTLFQNSSFDTMLRQLKGKPTILLWKLKAGIF